MLLPLQWHQATGCSVALHYHNVCRPPFFFCTMNQLPHDYTFHAARLVSWTTCEGLLKRSFMIQIVDNEHRNNTVKFEKKNQRSIFEYLRINLAFGPVEINGNLNFSQNWDSEVCTWIFKILMLTNSFLTIIYNWHFNQI